MAAIELKNVVKRFKTDTVLNDVSLSVDDGETLVLFGPSGCRQDGVASPAGRGDRPRRRFRLACAGMT